VLVRSPRLLFGFFLRSILKGIELFQVHLRAGLLGFDTSLRRLVCCMLGGGLGRHLQMCAEALPHEVWQSRYSIITVHPKIRIRHETNFGTLPADGRENFTTKTFVGKKRRHKYSLLTAGAKKAKPARKSACSK